jgi:hypothetical protein
MPDNTLDPTTVAALPVDATFIADAAAAQAIGETSVAAEESEMKEERDEIVFRVAQGGT